MSKAMEDRKMDRQTVQQRRESAAKCIAESSVVVADEPPRHRDLSDLPKFFNLSLKPSTW